MRVIKLKTILMKFQAPLQSYGTDSHFETRHTDDHPSKSAIIGIIAAALGIRREEPERLKELQNLRILVRVDQAGRVMRDFQIAAKFKITGDFERNYVTYRDYLEDAIYIVAIEGESSLILNIYEALKRPYFQLYYGKRSCPVNYDFLIGIHNGSAYENITDLPWMASEWYQKNRSKQEKIRIDLYGDNSYMSGEKQNFLRRDQAISFSQLKRQHDWRFEYHKNIWITNPNYVDIKAQTDHDALAALMEA